MPKLLGNILCEWDQQGKIEHTVISDLNLSPSIETNLLGLSMTMLLSHQLGTLRPSHGLILCSQVIDYYAKSKYIVYPINSALKKTSIEIREGLGGEATLIFNPGHSLFANNDSLEEGVRQFLNNYIFYVCEKLNGDLKFIVRGRTLATINSYVEMIDTAVSLGKIGPQKDLWNLSFSTEMAKMTYVLGSTFQYKLPDNTPQEYMEQKFNEKFPETLKIHSSIGNNPGDLTITLCGSLILRVICSFHISPQLTSFFN